MNVVCYESGLLQTGLLMYVFCMYGSVLNGHRNIHGLSVELRRSKSLI